MFVSQAEPVQPGWQMHSWSKRLSTQMPFKQGFPEQRSIFSWQRLPEKPGGQSQLKSATRSVQLAPSRQGLSAQSSVLISQLWPSHPSRHSHLNLPCWRATQVAPLLQGFPLAVQGLIWNFEKNTKTKSAANPFAVKLNKYWRLSNHIHAYRDVTIDSSVTGSAETRVIVESRFVLAHCTLRASVVRAVGLFFLTVDTGIAVCALATIALRKIDASRPVVTRLRGAFVDVDFATSSGESGGTETLNFVAHLDTQSTVLTSAFGALDRFAFFVADRAGTVGVHFCWTFHAGGCTVLGLEEILRTLSARSETGIGVHAWWTLCTATIATWCRWLIRERSCWTSLTVFVTADWRIARVTVSRTLQTWYQTSWRISSITAHGYTIVDALWTDFASVSAEWTTQTGSLTIAVLVESFLARCTLFLFLSRKTTGRTMHCGDTQSWQIYIWNYSYYLLFSYVMLNWGGVETPNEK